MKNLLRRIFYKIRSKKRCILIITGLLIVVILFFVLARNVSESKIVQDVDGNIYQTVQIGEQVWLVENLKTKTHPTGESWCYDNSESNCDVYGRLYDWDAAKTVCPEGWLLPSDSDWQDLEEFLGGSEKVAKELKHESYWAEEAIENISPINPEEYDEKSFYALPGGHYVDKFFYDLGKGGFWWTSTDLEGIKAAWSRVMRFDSEELVRSSFGLEHGFSVRCIKEKVENE